MSTPQKTEKTKSPRARGPKKKNRWLGSAISTAVVLALLVAGVLVALYLNRETAEVVPAVRGKAISAVYGTVKIEWDYTQPVRSENEGYLQLSPTIPNGQSSIGINVKKGQTLATIADDSTSRLIQQAKTDLQAAQDRQRIGPASAISLRNAEDSLKRLNQLQTLSGNVAQASLDQAKNGVTQLKDTVKTEQIELDRVVDNLNQSLSTLVDKLRKTEIKSPMDGILTAINANDGERVMANDTLFTVAVNRTYINGQVNEEDVGSLKMGMKATIRLYSFVNEEFSAQLTSIRQGGDPTTQRYTVLLAFENGHMPSNLMAGMTGEMNIILGERENSILIPASALLVDKVFLVKDGVVVPRDVVVGFRSMEKVEILSGLEEGDLVIKSDQDKFSPGQRVRAIQVNTIKVR